MHSKLVNNPFELGMNIFVDRYEHLHTPHCLLYNELSIILQYTLKTEITNI